MALERVFTGFSIGDSFTPTPGANNIVTDAGNIHNRAFVWFLPLTTGTFTAFDLNGLALPVVTFTAKDLNIVFPIPVTRIAAMTGTGICVYPGN